MVRTASLLRKPHLARLRDEHGVAAVARVSNGGRREVGDARYARRRSPRLAARGLNGGHASSAWLCVAVGARARPGLQRAERREVDGDGDVRHRARVLVEAGDTEPPVVGSVGGVVLPTYLFVKSKIHFNLI